MTEPINNKTLGGLTYNANLVSSATKLKNGKYELVFKTGEKFIYPEQKPFEVAYVNDDRKGTATTGETVVKNGYLSKGDILPRGAKIEQTVKDGWIYDDTSFDISNVTGAHFSSSEKTVAHVNLNNSSNTTIDLSANDSQWYADCANINDGANNKVILDGQDTAVINENFVEGEGVASQKDYK